MLFLYPLGNGSNCNDLELLWSMRMVAKHSSVNPFFTVVGEAPRWKKKYEPFPNYNDIPIRVKKANRNHIVATHLLYFLEQHNINSEFIFMNDDFIPLQSFDAISMPLYFDMSTRERIGIAGINPIYKMVLENSIFNENDLNFAVHLPMPIRDIDLFKYSLRYCLAKNGGCSFRNVYGNMVMKNEKIEKTQDVKLYGHTLFNADTFKGKKWISLSDDCMVPQNQNYLTSIFT